MSFFGAIYSLSIGHNIQLNTCTYILMYSIHIHFYIHTYINVIVLFSIFEPFEVLTTFEQFVQFHKVALSGAI